VAFSTKAYTEEEQELVVLVTPHLVDAMDCHQVAKVLPAEETRTPDDFELFLEGILEAPRGPREVFPGGHYVPAYKSGPTAGQFPCAETNKCGNCNGKCFGKRCGAKGCPGSAGMGCDDGACTPMGAEDVKTPPVTAPQTENKEQQAPAPQPQEVEHSAPAPQAAAQPAETAPAALPDTTSAAAAEGAQP
jgi:pilus assembly protein CpaC